MQVQAEVSSAWGPPTVLINNAAIDSPPSSDSRENGPFEDYPESSWDKVLEVNLKGAYLCCQVFGSAMAKKGSGSIINVASIYGLVSPDQSLYEYRRRQGQEFYKPVAYSASKSGLLNLTRYLAVYWAKQKVRVNTLTIAGVANHQDQSFLQAYCGRIPIGRMADSDEYNGAVLFLASDASGNVFALWSQQAGAEPRRIMSARLPRGRAAWSEPVALGLVGNDANAPQIAIDRLGRALAVWQQDTVANGQRRILSNRFR